MDAKILVIDDEAQIRKFLRISMGAAGYEVLEAETGAKGIDTALAAQPDLIVLDLGLPDMDGQDVITTIRQSHSMPLIVLSVRAGEADKVEALDRGANDYVVKPFGVAELMARIRALLRPKQTAKDGGEVIACGPLRIDLTRHILSNGETEIHLSKREWALLAFLARHPDHVLTHRLILKEVWGPAHVEDTAYLRVYVNQLRQKLEDDPANPKRLVTDPGVGYRLKCGE
ncbi:MAG: response regulator transcription factor [Alphaproteobacteria bacterium]|nr:response regulator transcription factor [Alphaproteobacteria bacterium]